MPSLAYRSDTAGSVRIPLALITALKSDLKKILNMWEMWILRPLPIYSVLSPREVVYKIDQSFKSWMDVERGKVHPRTGNENPEGIRL